MLDDDNDLHVIDLGFLSKTDEEVERSTPFIESPEYYLVRDN